MTTIARDRRDAPQTTAEHVARIEKAQDTKRISRRGLAPAGTAAAGADLHDRRHADPVPVHALLLDAVLEPGSPGVAALRRAAELRRRVPGQHVLAVAFNTVVIIVGTVLVSLLLGLRLAMLLDREFLGRGVVRTLLITPFLVMPVAGALLWKTTMFDPLFGIINWVLSPFGVHNATG